MSNWGKAQEKQGVALTGSTIQYNIRLLNTIDNWQTERRYTPNILYTKVT